MEKRIERKLLVTILFGFDSISQLLKPRNDELGCALSWSSKNFLHQELPRKMTNEMGSMNVILSNVSR
jgi:hypothetical protein